FVTILHSLCGLTSIIFDILLLFCMFRSTPTSFSTFSILLKMHAFSDLAMAIGGVASMIRVISIDWSVIYISYGPCTLIGPSVCYAFYMMLIAGANITMYTILVSFLFRLLMLRNAQPTVRQVYLMIVGMILPVPTTLIVCI
ncbi:hypothetical protein PFISCL1PPCAC_11432, partial [Pristionchus fissidentatus]